RLCNRKKNDRTLNYPELTRINSWCQAQSVILDGEIVALDDHGIPDFHEVMKRDGIRRENKVSRIMGTVPIFYMIFDIVYLNGEWIHKQRLTARQKILKDIIQPNDHVQLVRSEESG